MYEVFEELLRNRGISISKCAKDIGIRPSTITDWRAGRYVPKADKRKKIADYFGVSLEYLDTGIEPDTITLSRQDKDVLKMIRDNPKLFTWLSLGNNLVEEDFNIIKSLAERLSGTHIV